MEFRKETHIKPTVRCHMDASYTSHTLHAFSVGGFTEQSALVGPGLTQFQIGHFEGIQAIHIKPEVERC